jgi:hypothetical protein
MVFVSIGAPTEFIWRFARAEETIEIRRKADANATELVALGTGGRRTFDFDTHAELVAFHAQFETHLVESGWVFVEFDPERRTQERRQRPQASDDRRRVLPWRGTE